MAKEIMYPPLVHWKSLLKGVFGGSLLIGGLASPGLGMAFQAVLALLGLIVIVDGVMVTGKGVHIVVCLLFAVIAGAATLVVSMTFLGTAYLIAIFILTILLYTRAYVRPPAPKKKHEAAHE